MIARLNASESEVSMPFTKLLFQETYNFYRLQGSFPDRLLGTPNKQTK